MSDNCSFVLIRGADLACLRQYAMFVDATLDSVFKSTMVITTNRDQRDQMRKREDAEDRGEEMEVYSEAPAICCLVA